MPIHHPAIHHRHHTPHAIVMKVGDERPVPLTDQLRKEYERFYTTQKVNPNYQQRLSGDVNLVVAGWDRYTLVSERTGVPWYVIGVMHLLECDCRFDCHLHNGDPLSHRTVHVPKGRPPGATWTWEDSAVDALQLEGLDKWTDWGIAGTLYKLESFNGFGSRNHGIPTPYLWSGTGFYRAGKYGKDGHWDPHLVSEQVGAAPILKAMNDANKIQVPQLTITSAPCEVP